MSASINPNYTVCINQCLETLVACRKLLSRTRPEAPCYSAAKECLHYLRRSIKMMRNESKFATRYLVDCAEACIRCARLCEACNDEHCQRCGASCRACATACRARNLVEEVSDAST